MPATIEELSLRQTVLETIVATSLDADGVLSELNNEAAQLSETSARLQSRRDRAVNTANLANLVTGTGLGIGVNALQFSSTTANIGNGLGVASGIASTLLSIVGIRLQRGPKVAVGRVPNMLAPLFGQEPKLNTFYSPEVLTYLRSVPESNQPSRLDELFAEWRESGRIGASDSPGNKKKIQLLTAGSGDKVKLSINDLSDRTAMLTDVAGKVALMKRDVAALMLSVRRKLDCGAR